jgi:hypothetical protein
MADLDSDLAKLIFSDPANPVRNPIRILILITVHRDK